MKRYLLLGFAVAALALTMLSTVSTQTHVRTAVPNAGHSEAGLSD